MTAPRSKTARKGARRPGRASRRKSTRRTTPTATELAGSALETGRSLWLAGLGLALTTVETVDEAFENLVARGRAREPKTIAAAEKLVREARRTADGLASDAARATREKLDQALDALGVENRARPKNLFHRLGDLAEAIL